MKKFLTMFLVVLVIGFASGGINAGDLITQEQLDGFDIDSTGLKCKYIVPWNNSLISRQLFFSVSCLALREIDDPTYEYQVIRDKKMVYSITYKEGKEILDTHTVPQAKEFIVSNWTAGGIKFREEIRAQLKEWQNDLSDFNPDFDLDDSDLN